MVIHKKTAGAYLREILSLAASEDPVTYKKALGEFSKMLGQVVLESSQDETFYLRGEADEIKVLQRKPQGTVHVNIRISPAVIFDILQGVETPIEAFFLGHLRARGTTADLYKIHHLLILLAEVAVRSKKITALIEEFKQSKGIED